MTSLATSSACITGSRTSKTLPLPGVLWAVIVPPWRSTILRQMASPMPVPSYTSRGCSRWKMPKIRSRVLLLEPDAVVLDDDAALLLGGRWPGRRCSRPCTNRPATFTTGGSSGAVELQRVADQVLQQAAASAGDRPGWWASAPTSTRPPTLLDLHLQVGRRPRGRPAPDRRRRSSCPCVVTRESDSSPSISSCIRAAALCIRSRHSRPSSSSLSRHFDLQAVAEGADLAQRLLQVVRGDVGELLQLAVRSLQFGGIAGLLLLRPSCAG